ncbi:MULTISPECIES: ion channel [Bacillaceae]|uniref:ion channel n=2 Tax=Bacillales TaxID=1385 RepID=UPI001E5ED7C2|nr:MULTISPECIES: ion channel [Bacillaceae]MCE4050159.1 potassium channel family protein [Bacillus sp. Au-Bac7]MCM3031597.1 potassium channel family protein [Niallia sp. MER 6]MDL0435476.1 ion channel [Niallia sp. SS-2023]UPO88201.1 potassium channel family protein [Niallia sp. Man26]
MFFYFLLAMIIFFIMMSLRTLFVPYRLKEKWVSFENFIYLFFVYITIMIGFGLIYTLLQLNGVEVYNESEQMYDSSLHFIDMLQTGIYFSGITLFSVGFGDLAPIGFGRLIVVIEALIGYTIPAAFVARAVLDMDS